MNVQMPMPQVEKTAVVTTMTLSMQIRIEHGKMRTMSGDGTETGNQCNFEATITDYACKAGILDVRLLVLFAPSSAAVFECTVRVS